MKLYFLNPSSRAAINVARLRRCGYDVGRIIAASVENLDALVVIGDGTPDDRVLGILSYHINGGKVVGVVKPEGATHLSVLDHLKTYLSSHRGRLKKIMVIIDQENLDLDRLFGDCLTRIQGIGIDVSNIEEMDRLRVYQCSLTGKGFEIIIVANGLEEVCTQSHTIEDHLIKAAGTRMRASNATRNSKQRWWSLPKARRENTFRRLKRNRNLITEVFPQQASGCARIKRERT